MTNDPEQPQQGPPENGQGTAQPHAAKQEASLTNARKQQGPSTNAKKQEV